MQVGADRAPSLTGSGDALVRVLMLYVTARGELRTHRVADRVPVGYQGSLLKVDISESGFKGWAIAAIDTQGFITARYVPKMGGLTTPIPVTPISDVKSPAPLEVRRTRDPLTSASPPAPYWTEKV